MHLSKTDKKNLCEIMETDTQFLKDLNIMDYSLLLGIEKKSINWADSRNSQNSRLVMELIERKAPVN